MSDHKAKLAFEILARENARMLTAYLRSVVIDEAAVDDLFQDTMVVAWKRLDECDLSQPFGPWLRGIASRLVMAYYRQRKRMPVLLDEGVLSLIDQQFISIDAQVGDTWDEKLLALRSCLDSLPDPQKQIVHARYFEELSAQQVAERFQLSMEACKKRLQRGRRMLAACLKRKELLVSLEGMS